MIHIEPFSYINDKFVFNNKYPVSTKIDKDYIHKLNIMLEKLVGQKYINEFNHPRHLSLVMFGINLFPYKIEDYREMAELIKG